ncbi:hypothetical protein GCM10025867_48120 (plasmid) [Frondihabitans sucicola]|uniref:Uncharacterized protein n=1 Tax=Frondihabitans sucicola TaxID=1268041 RepID=A0ABM8GVS7_9MICO|nr:hypothetical protein [Frondihabitans sucicola]BDZ52571.1 hypothetical protein GCM10025867_48120 [Frondihabitans sucicola]
MEQRNGRGIRPGNLNTEVSINRYVTQGSFDGYMYQLVEKKQRFMSQLYRVDASVREIEDIADLVLSYGEVKALAAGNPLLLEQSSATAELKRLQTLRTLHNQAIKKARQDADQDERVAQTLNARVIMLDKARGALKPDAAEISLDALAGAISRDIPTANGYRGVELRYKSTIRDGGDQPREVTVDLNRFTMHAIGIPDRTFRRGPASIRDYIQAEFTTWADGLDALRDSTLERQQDLLIRIDETRAAATGSAPFPQAEALQAARMKLARIEQALAEAAEPVDEVDREDEATSQQAA